MSATIGVTEALTEKVVGFVWTESIPVKVVPGGSGAVEVVESKGRLQSDRSTLQVGGWITCGDARAMASSLGIPLQTMGKLTNLVDVKVRNCELGLF